MATKLSVFFDACLLSEPLLNLVQKFFFDAYTVFFLMHRA